MELHIGANIKRLRSAKNITQEQLSQAMNVTCAAVSKWERDETYPDITLIQPLAYYFQVTVDELMGYSEEKVRADIDARLDTYRRLLWKDPRKAREIIVQAYRDYPNDYEVMHNYLWHLAGGSADNDPAVLMANEKEFSEICDKILSGCPDEGIRLEAWNMRAKLLHAKGRTEEALAIYAAKFPNFYRTCEQSSEQLFAKGSEEYAAWVQQNMYKLADFAADKLGRTVFFRDSLSMKEKTDTALLYGRKLLESYAETGEAFFLVTAYSFLGRMENDLVFRGGSDGDVTAVMDEHLRAAKELTERMKADKPLREAYRQIQSSVEGELLAWLVNFRLNGDGRRAELLQNSAYRAVLEKYR